MPAACLLIVFLFGADVRVLHMPDRETCEMLAKSIMSANGPARSDGAGCFPLYMMG